MEDEEEVNNRGIPASESPGALQTTSSTKWLQLAALLAAAVVLPYIYSVNRQIQSSETTGSELLMNLMANAGLTWLISLGFISLGFRLRRSLGLDSDLLINVSPGNSPARWRIKSVFALSFIAGLGLGCLIATSDYFAGPYLPEPSKPLSSPPVWMGLLVSVGAGVQEEIWLRWGIMTSAVWLGTRIMRRPAPEGGIVWTGNVLAATLFGVIHIPQAITFYELTPMLLAVVLLGNGVPGVIFGWLYWRHGIIAAMICHSSADMLLKVILPLCGMA